MQLKINPTRRAILCLPCVSMLIATCNLLQWSSASGNWPNLTLAARDLPYKKNMCVARDFCHATPLAYLLGPYTHPSRYTYTDAHFAGFRAPEAKHLGFSLGEVQSKRCILGGVNVMASHMG